jgi:sulfate adenylyltransferase
VPALLLAPHELSDLRLLAWGAYAPLTGFLGEDDYAGVIGSMRLDSGALWSLPVALSLDPDAAEKVKGVNEVDLLASTGEVVGILQEPEVYLADSVVEAREVFGTQDPDHPGVARLLSGGEWRAGGRVTLADPSALDLPVPFDRHPASPNAVREEIGRRGWHSVVAFQTRNPIHRAHEHLTKVALEGVDGLLVHPLVGETKDDDVPAEVRLRCYETLLAEYYPPGRTLLALFPAPMRYAGPREAVFHAQVRANYGATHFIVGRDHAGVGTYYDTYAAQELLAELGPAELGITPLYFEHAFYCGRCGQMATAKTCPHDAAAHVALSGTRVRQLLAAGESLPVEYSRPEVAALLVDAYKDAHREEASS